LCFRSFSIESQVVGNETLVMNTSTNLLPPPKRARVTIDVDAALWESLKAEAAAEERTAASAIRQAVRTWVNQHREQRTAAG
jgi:hypothetical protein